jgi:hypothetical protein
LSLPPTLDEQALLSELLYYNLYYVICVKIAKAIEEARMTVQMELDQLKEASGTETGSPYHAALMAVASFALMGVVVGVSKIVAEQRVVDN